jgi:U4/U6.U5 tri-snRNP-associated protein 1
MLKLNKALVVAEERERINNADDGNVLPKEEQADKGLVFDDTSEFVRSIVYDPEGAKMSTANQPTHKEEVKAEGSPTPESEELEAGEVDMKEEEEAALHALQIEVDMNGANVKKETNAEVSCIW